MDPLPSSIPISSPPLSTDSSFPSSSSHPVVPVVVRRGKPCDECTVGRAILQRPATGQKLCKPCFLTAFEEEVHETIVREQLFRPGERIAIGASGGKDSTVLAFVLHKLNTKYRYGVELVLVSVDEGIQGYRDASLERVKETSEELQIPLRIISYQELFGWPMDRVVSTTGGRNSCSYCGVFRRQALDKGSVLTRSHKIAIGHNADDVAETALMNLLRGDIARLGRCVKAMTGGELLSSSSSSTIITNNDDHFGGPLPRVKPLITCYEKEIVAYAHHAKLPYHATECSYSPAAYRGFLREMIKDLEAVRPSIIRDIIRAANFWQVDEIGNNNNSNSTNQRTLIEDKDTHHPNQRSNVQDTDDTSSVTSHQTRTTTVSAATVTSSKLTMKQRVAGTCIRCGYLSSSTLCQACNLLIGLEAGNPRLGLTGGNSNQSFIKEIMLASSSSSSSASSISSSLVSKSGTLSVGERAKQHLLQIKQQTHGIQPARLLDSVKEDNNEGCNDPHHHPCNGGTETKQSSQSCNSNNGSRSCCRSTYPVLTLPSSIATLPESKECCSNTNVCACQGNQG